MRVDDVGLLRRCSDAAGDLAAQPEPDEALGQLMEPEQQRQRTDDQFAPDAHPTQSLHPHAGDQRTRGEISLRREAHRCLDRNEAWAA